MTKENDGLASETVRIPAALIRAQLERVLRSRHLSQAPMLSRLLQFLVERTIEGDSDSLKEYSVGVEVFDRGPSFDPRTDTIVRVQARRLRSKLEDYYRQEGHADPIVLELPKGRYKIEYRQAPHASYSDRPSVPSGSSSTPGTAEHLRGLWPAGSASSSIVVLPFANLSGDPADDYLADGLTEEIISTLAALPELSVVARTSAFQFKGRAEDIRAIGRHLDVRTALEGSLRKEGGRIRVAAQLIDVSSGLHLWSQIYARELTGVFRIQMDIAEAIVEALRIRLAPADTERLRPPEPVSAEAYQEYLKGRYFWHKATPADLEKSIQHLERAIALDGGYAAAHAGVSDAYILLSTMQLNAPWELLPKAKAAAQRALALGDFAESHSAMGTVLGVQGDSGAEREFRRALSLKPSFVLARVGYAVVCLSPQRRYEEAIEQLREALGRDPLSVFTRSMLAQTLVLARLPDAAIDELRQVLELEPGFGFGHLTLALAHLARGAHREALDVLQQLPEPAAVAQTPNYAGYLGYAQARLGNRAEAERILRDLLARFPGPWVPAVDVAAISVGLGDTDTALQWLERACADRSFDSLLVVDDPRFLDLHADSRFRRLLQEMRQAVDRPAT